MVIDDRELCFSLTLNEHTHLFNVKFDDYQRAVISSLLYDGSRFSFRLDRVEFMHTSTLQNPIQSVQIKTPPHMFPPHQVAI